MSERRSVADMLGEFLREAAVLIIVFSPLDRIVRNQPLTLTYVNVIVALSGALLGLGMGFERWRKT